MEFVHYVSFVVGGFAADFCRQAAKGEVFNFY